VDSSKMIVIKINCQDPLDVICEFRIIMFIIPMSTN
jgi:hypothetical protein